MPLYLSKCRMFHNYFKDYNKKKKKNGRKEKRKEGRKEKYYYLVLGA